jgi:hypothetical protein
MSAGLGVVLTGGLAVTSPYQTNYVDALRNWRVGDLRKLLATMVLTGGTVYAEESSYKYCVRYYGKDIILHTIFCDLIRHIQGIVAKPAQWLVKGSYVTQVYSKSLVDELFKLSPSYTTRNCNGDNNTNDCQCPVSADFLFDAEQNVIKESVRLASSSNGALYCTVDRRSNDHKYFVRPRFAFGYLSPTPLLDDYKHILQQIELDMFPVFDKRYGKGFLVSNSWDTFERFAKIGGFIEGIKINHGHYKRMERNSLLNGALIFHRLEDNAFNTREEAMETVQKHVTYTHLAQLKSKLNREGYFDRDIGIIHSYPLNEHAYSSIETLH